MKKLQSNKTQNHTFNTITPPLDILLASSPLLFLNRFWREIWLLDDVNSDEKSLTYPSAGKFSPSKSFLPPTSIVFRRCRFATWYSLLRNSFSVRRTGKEISCGSRQRHKRQWSCEAALGFRRCFDSNWNFVIVVASCGCILRWSRFSVSSFTKINEEFQNIIMNYCTKLEHNNN